MNLEEDDYWDLVNQADREWPAEREPRVKPLKCVCGDPREVCPIHEKEDQNGEVQG